ncbi:MAG: T9SS type A sorting domain-containing protein, partial [Candidatus Cloacimonadaceae bacterium]|nr:T9SS type A sorting domain-containing protein [Candidatus Cloacimonadaceae bacterium]
ELSFDFSTDGSYSIYAIDRSDNVSSPLTGDYSYEPPQSALLIYPNPIRDIRSAFLEWFFEQSKDESVSLRLYNIKGQRLIDYRFNVPSQSPGMLKLDLVPGLSGLAQGIYLLELNSGGRKMHKKLTILY